MNGPSLPPIPLQQLRNTLEARLAALEKALADPAHHPSLEQLILELARAATEEADAAARQALVEVERQSHSLANSARSEGRAALEAEQAAAASLREKLQQRELEFAALRAEIDQARSDLKKERAAAEARARDQSQAAQALAAEQAARKKDKEAYAAEQAAHAKDQEAARKQLEQVQVALESERTAARAGDRELAGKQEALERDLQNERAAHAKERDAGVQLREAVARLERDLAGARGEADAQAKSLTRTQGETEKSLQEAQQALGDTAEELAEARRALKDAEARAEEAIQAQLILQKQLDDHRGEAEARSKRPSKTETELEKSLKGTQRTLAETMDTLTETQEALKAAEARWEVAEQQLSALRASFISGTSGTSGSSGEAAGEATSASAPLEAGAEQPVYRGPARSAKRITMPPNTEVQVDGIPGTMVDVSLTGAQILMPSPLKPNRSLKLTIPHGDAVVTCKGKVMWSRLEPAMRDGQLWYRGGVLFSSSDNPALRAFIKSHAE